MLWLVACVLFNIANADKMTISDILEMSKSITDTWSLEEITFIDVTEGASDDDLQEAYNYLHQSKVTARFLSSRGMSIRPIDLGSAWTQGCIIINSDDPVFFKQISNGLLESQTWFIPENTDLGSINVRLDSNLYLYSKVNFTTIIFNEVFAAKRGPMIEQTVGYFTIGHGLELFEYEMWERRKNLSTVTLSNALLEAELLPLSNVTRTKEGIVNIGYLPDMLDQLSAILNFKIVGIVAEDGQFGFKGANGSWNGLMGLMTRKEADVCTFALTIGYDRSLAVDFTIPLVKQQMTLMMKKQTGGGVVNVWAYMATFALAPWIIIGFSLFALVFGLMIVGKYDIQKINFEDSAGLVFISLLQRDHHITGTRNSSKLLIFTVCMYFFVIFVHYSTVLTSYMTVLETSPQIQSFSDVLKYNYHMITVKGSIYEAMVVNSKPPSPLYDIYHKDMKRRPRAFLPLSQVLDEIRNDPNSVYFGPASRIYGQQDLIALKLTDAAISYTGIGLQKNSEFTRLFTYQLLKMEQSGIMEKITAKWFNDNSTDEDPRGLEEEHIVLGYDNLIFPCILLASGVVLAGLLLALEIMLKEYVSNRKALHFGNRLYSSK